MGSAKRSTNIFKQFAICSLTSFAHWLDQFNKVSKPHGMFHPNNGKGAVYESFELLWSSASMDQRPSLASGAIASNALPRKTCLDIGADQMSLDSAKITWGVWRATFAINEKPKQSTKTPSCYWMALANTKQCLAAVWCHVWSNRMQSKNLLATTWACNLTITEIRITKNNRLVFG